MTSYCPACKQALPAGKGRRRCSLCHQPIRRREKWQTGMDNQPQHLDCNNPRNPGQPPEESEPLLMEVHA